MNHNNNNNNNHNNHNNDMPRDYIQEPDRPEEDDENNIDVEELIQINIARGRAAIIPEVQRFYAPAPLPAPVLLPAPRRAPAPPGRILDLGLGRGYVPIPPPQGYDLGQNRAYDLAQNRAYDLGQGRAYDPGRGRRRGNDRGGPGGFGGNRLPNGELP